MCGAKYFVEPYREGKSKFCGFTCKQRAATISRNRKSRFSGRADVYVKLNGRHMHRVVAEQKIGRALLPGEIVHHIDGDRRNNAPENLEVMMQTEHIKLHLPMMRRRQNELAKQK